MGLQVFLPYSEQLATGRRRIYKRNKTGTSPFAEHTQVRKRSSNREKPRDGDQQHEPEAETNLLAFPMCNNITLGNKHQAWELEMSQYTICDTSNCLKTTNPHNTNYNTVSDDLSPLLTLLSPPNAGLCDSDSRECHVSKARKWPIETEAVFATGQAGRPGPARGRRILSRPPLSPTVPRHLLSSPVVFLPLLSSSVVLHHLPLSSVVFRRPLPSPAVLCSFLQSPGRSCPR